MRWGVKMWPVNGSMIKEELYRWLGLARPTEESGIPHPPGYCHFPKYGEEYFKQLTAEQLVTRVVKGYRRGEWQKTRDRNEALDCRVYARAAAAVHGMDLGTDADWDRLCVDLAELVMQAKDPDRTPSPRAQRPRVIHSPYIGNTNDWFDR